MGKKISIRQIFYQVFMEDMQKRGFVLSRKYGMFLKVVNKELLLYVTLEKRVPVDKGKQSFSITGNITSVYTESLEEKDLLFHARRLYWYSRIMPEFQKMLPECYSYSEADSLGIMELALSDARKSILKKMEEVTCPEKYLVFCKKMNPECFQMKYRFSGDSLALIAFHDHDDFLDVLDYTIGQSFADRPEKLQEAKKKFYYYMVELTAGKRDEIYNDPKLYQEAVDECERRKNKNLLLLKDLKVI